MKPPPPLLLLLLFAVFFDHPGVVAVPCKCTDEPTTPKPPVIPELNEWKDLPEAQIEFLNYKYPILKPFVRPVLKKTVMYYNITFTCHRKDFCASTYYLEIDYWTGRNLQYVDLSCTRTGFLFHSAQVIFSGGDGWFDNYYEPLIITYHNCHYRDQMRSEYFWLPVVPITRSAGYMDALFDLSIPDIWRPQHLVEWPNYRSFFNLIEEPGTTDFFWRKIDVTKDPKYNYLFTTPIIVEERMTEVLWTFKNGTQKLMTRRCHFSTIRKYFQCDTYYGLRGILPFGVS